MKKLLSALLCLLMIVGAISPISAANKSIEKLSGGQQVENASKSYEITYKDKTARVFYGSNGIDIVCEDETVHYSTNFPVLKLIVVGDVNGDGFTDFAITQNSPDSADNLFVIDGSNGKVLNSTCLTRETVDEGQFVVANTYVLDMKIDGVNLYVIYDHTILVYNLSTGEKVFEYVNEDNVWDLEVLEDRIAYIDQLGRIGFIDLTSGDLLSINKISNEYTCEVRWDPGATFIRNMNLWDIYNDNGTLYVTSEDGYLYTVDYEGNKLNEIFLNAFNLDDYVNSLSDDMDWSGRGYSGKVVGILDSNFKSFKIIDNSEQYLLIGNYFIDENTLDKNNNYYAYQGVTVVDKWSNEAWNQKTPNTDSIGLAACFTVYDQQDAVVVAKAESSTSTKLEFHSFDGTLLYQKSVDVVNAENNPILTIEKLENGYFIESYHAASTIVDENYKVKYLFETASVELKYLGDSITYMYIINGRSKRIVNLAKDCVTVNWEYEVPESTTNKGIEQMLVEDYNGDGIVDYICLVQNYDKDGNGVDTTFLILDGATGNRINERKIFEYESYNSAGKKYNVYIKTNEVELIKDINGDKKKELIVNGYLVSSNGLVIKGNINSYIDAKGQQIEIGDINGDRIMDYMMLTETSATLYRSRIQSYNVDYVKANVSISLNKNYKCNEYFTIIGDINHDGVYEIAFPSVNEYGFQTFNIHNGKTLAKMFTLCPKGVGYYEALNILDLDINGDGYSELLHYSDAYGYNGILDGKTGEPYLYFNLWEKNDYTAEEIDQMEIWHPEEKIRLTIPEDTNFSLIQFRDVTGDGKEDYAIIKQYTDEETWRSYESIFVYDANDLSQVKEINIRFDDFVMNMAKVEDADNLIVLSTYNKMILQDIEKEETIASYNLVCEKFTKVNDTTILAMDRENKLYLINTESGFELLNKVDENITDHIVDFAWKNNAEYSVMTVYDNNELIYRGSAEQLTVRFTEGEHVVVFELDDGQGKTTVKSISFNLAKQENKQVYLSAVAVVVLLVAVALSVYRKMYIAKRVKGGLK